MMKASNVSFAISTVLAELGMKDAAVEQSEEKNKGLACFDIQRSGIKGEEQWFCFRVTFHVGRQQAEIITRKDLKNERVEPSWSLYTMDDETLNLWLHLCFDRDFSILEELTRP